MFAKTLFIKIFVVKTLVLKTTFIKKLVLKTTFIKTLVLKITFLKTLILKTLSPRTLIKTPMSINFLSRSSWRLWTSTWTGLGPSCIPPTSWTALRTPSGTPWWSPRSSESAPSTAGMRGSTPSRLHVSHCYIVKVYCLAKYWHCTLLIS